MKKPSKAQFKVLKKMNYGYYLFWSVFGKIKNGYATEFIRTLDDSSQPIFTITIKKLVEKGLIEIDRVVEWHKTTEKRNYYRISELGKQALNGKA